MAAKSAISGEYIIQKEGRIHSILIVAAFICIAAICVFITAGCNRENMKPITTKQVVEIATTSAKTGGIINANNAGGPHGVCFNTTGTPTLDDYHTLDGYGPCEYNTELTGLEPGTTYYVRAYYCSNMHYDDVTYGNEVTFKTVPIPGPELHTAMELLTIPQGWVLSEATSSPSYELSNGVLVDDLMHGYLYDFEIDDIIRFSSDGTHCVHPNRILPEGLEFGYTQETSLGQWHFDNPDNPAYLFMQIPFIYGDGLNTYNPAIEECRIISLTTDMLKISFTYIDDEYKNATKGSYTFTLTYVPAR